MPITEKTHGLRTSFYVCTSLSGPGPTYWKKRCRIVINSVSHALPRDTCVRENMVSEGTEDFAPSVCLTLRSLSEMHSLSIRDRNE